MTITNMTTIDQQGYLTRQVAGTHGRKTTKGRPTRNWWLIKHTGPPNSTSSRKILTLNIPPKYIGKRLRFKIEVVP